MTQWKPEKKKQNKHRIIENLHTAKSLHIYIFIIAYIYTLYVRI